MKKLILPIIFLSGLAFWIYQQKFTQKLGQQAPLPSMGKITDFTLSDQNGEAFGSSELEGKIWIVSFMFTRCQGPCPMMSQKMARLHKDFQPFDDILQLSISMDPEYDQAEILKAYGKKYNADARRWKFLTGPKDSIINLAIQAFRLPAGQDPNAHSTRFVLVDQRRQIRGYYDSFDTKALKKLQDDVRRLQQEATPASV